MKINQKQIYISPRIEVMPLHNESLLAGASVEVEENNAFKREDYTPGGEHHGGDAEW